MHVQPLRVQQSGTYLCTGCFPFCACSSLQNSYMSHGCASKLQLVCTHQVVSRCAQALLIVQDQPPTDVEQGGAPGGPLDCVLQVLSIKPARQAGTTAAKIMICTSSFGASFFRSSCAVLLPLHGDETGE